MATANKRGMTLADRRKAAAAERQTAAPAARRAATPARAVKPALADVIDDVTDDEDEAFGPEDAVMPNTAEPVEEDDEEDEDVEDEEEEETPPPVTRSPGRAISKAGPRQLPMASHGIPSRARTIEARDQVMPKLRMGQGMSDAVKQGQVKYGNWYITGRNLDLGDAAYIIPIDMMKSRSIFKQGIGVICRSFDLVQGQGDPGILCEGTLEEMNDPSIREDDRGCEKRLWDDDGNGNRIPPECQLAYNYPVLVVIPNDDGELTGEGSEVHQAMLTIRGTSTPVAKIINSSMQGAEPIWWHHIFELTTTQKSSRGNTFTVAQGQWFDDTRQHPELLRRAEAYARQIGSSAAFMQQNLEADDRDTD